MDRLIPRPAALPNIELQRSGYIPSPEQTRAIEEYSTQLQSAQERLDAEIARLSARRRDIGRELEINRSLLAPVHRLPPELLSEIFTHAARNLRWPQTPSLFALTLCSVCATWRVTARSTPLLWRDIYLNRCMAGNAGNPLLHLHMHLSRQRPLCISSVRCEVALVEFLSTLPEPDAARLQELVLSENGNTLSKIQARPLPALSRAVITIHDTCPPDAFNVLVNATSLQDLTITYYAECTDEELENGLAFPRLNNTSEFASLTRVNLLLLADLPIWALFPTFATFAPTLRELEIGVNSFTDFEDTAPRTIYEMPRLRHASLGYHAHAFLAHINAPELDTLRLSNTFHSESSLAFSLPDFLHQQSCTSLSGLIGLTGLIRLSAEMFRPVQTKYRRRDDFSVQLAVC
ncbi:uncharacterized protein SCHCODRAFT_02637030 [Schizophyllum commune H4-8]|nr:uncharacterized protein SCHCODRAFT_02637030 [Schizophyllum commune H4-8]KAI5888555.1 hypothetical protein SCHCODRAFT_02637030 [Schizophyllum commune H4-8]